MGELTTLHRNVSSALILAARRWRRTSAAVLLEFNISEACAAALLAANRLDVAVRQITLAEHIGIEGASLVRLLDQLCDAGLARRDSDPEDRRAKIVSLTDRGRTAAVEMEQRLVALHFRMLGDVSASDLETTFRVLTAFSATDQSADDTSNELQIADEGLQESSADAFNRS
jgi:MarR family transcriptional regulator, transcriptional regulator for hemolysin